MSTTVEYYQLIFPQKLSSVDYLFICASDENNDIVLMQPTPYSEDTLEAEILYEDVVDIVVEYMLEEMEC